MSVAFGPATKACFSAVVKLAFQLCLNGVAMQVLHALAVWKAVQRMNVAL